VTAKGCESGVSGIKPGHRSPPGILYKYSYLKRVLSESGLVVKDDIDTAHHNSESEQSARDTVRRLP
jgi:hypothetical protein